MEMKNLTREIVKIGNRSLVEVYAKYDFGVEITTKFVVCSNYNPSKEFGCQWEWGHYFELWNGTREDMLKAAMNYILDNEQHDISWDRMCEIATLAIDGLFEDDEEQAEIYLDETLELTDEEREFFGRKKKCKYKVVEVKMTKELYAYKQLVVPEDWSDYQIRELADDLIEDVSDYDWDNDSWENETYVTDTLANELTESEVEDDYDVFNGTDDFE